MSVVVTCYNYAHYLAGAVQSAATQEGVLADVLIVDDASTDDSLQIARGLAARHSNVSVVEIPSNLGPAGAFNAGVREAAGEFVVRLDADDLLTPGSLRRAVEVARSFPSVGLVYGHPLHFRGEMLPPPRLRVTGWTLWPGRLWLSGRCRSSVNVITSPEVLMRRAVLEQVGYMSSLKHAHDMELWLRIAAFSNVAYVHGADQAWHREHDASLSQQKVNEIVDLNERLACFRTLFNGVAGSIPDAAQMNATAHRALVAAALASAQSSLDRGRNRAESADAYLEFARSLDPTVTTTARWRSLSRRRDRVLDRRRAIPAELSVAALARRATTRLRSELHWRRWHREGVYEL
ncbi:glycosyltransferase family 2 protein [Arthrobacter sp. NPDC089319]|uniref:glycosyltransferase family 2 protein n=1 Tax=Arthrobacter sp. NPDC089319 TaxID=3155915 RepID=UPI003435C5C6